MLVAGLHPLEPVREAAMLVELQPESLKKLSQDMRFKLWWGLVHTLPKEDVRALNLKLGSVFFPPDRIAWIEKKQEA